MNRFKQMIDEARARAEAAGILSEPALLTPPKNDVRTEEEEPVDFRNVRLPYSSDPEPIGDPWDYRFVAGRRARR